MQIIFKKRTVGQIEYGIIYGVVSLLALILARITPVLSLTPSCLFKAITGIPCPTCGSTRSVMHLTKGEIPAAFMMNPLMTICFLSAVLIFIYSLATLFFDLPKIKMIFTTKEGNALRISVFIIILIQWVYLIITM